MKKGDLITLRIEKLAYGGKGLGKVDNFVVFVNRALPGQLVKIQLVKKKANYAQGEIVEILEKSPLEVQPLCSGFGRCGGCLWQNLSYEAQLSYKEEQVKDSFLHIAGIQGFEILPIFPSPKIYSYRNKMEFAFGKAEDGNLSLGFHTLGRYDKIENITQCYLIGEMGNEILNAVREYFRSKGTEAYCHKSHRGFLRHLVLREGKRTGEIMVNLVTKNGSLDREGLVEVLRQVARENLTSVIWTVNDSLGDAVKWDSFSFLFGREFIMEKLLDLDLRISPFSFFQPNTEAAEILCSCIMDFADLQGTEKVLDLYSGIGTIGLILARKAKKVYGVEMVSHSVEDAWENARINEIKNAEFYKADVAEFLKGISDMEYFPLIILDPPRSGMTKEALKRTLAMGARKIIYVSCNPSTMARDVLHFVEGGYKLKKVQAVDLFPHTPHIEVIAQIIK